jgi:ribosomal protein S18 acetylase RimI-like enzyme
MLTIRKIERKDKDIYCSMAKDFYESDAVLIHVGEDHFISAFEELMSSDTYLECFIFEWDGDVAGYALLAKTYSQEAGGIAVWIDELYVAPRFRGRGIGHEFFSYLYRTRPDSTRRFRLEVEKENEGAVKLYRSLGFSPLRYDQMIVDFPEKK